MSFWQASVIVIGASLIILPLPLDFLATKLTLISTEEMPSFLEMSLIVLVFGLTAAAIRWTVARETVLPVAADEAAQSVTADDFPDKVVDARTGLPRLLARLPKDAAGRLIRLSARNHYVDVVTDKGTTSLLIRMSDAIAELDGIDGLRVHRSHWVAASAVRGHERKGDKRLLILADGARIPVSRNLQRDVVARGLL